MIRNTKQREVLKEVLANSGRPLTPAEIHEIACQTLPNIGLRTVYRHLNKLNERMEIAGVDYPGQPIRYETVDGHGSRPHLICRECNQVFGLPIDEPEITYPTLDGHQIDAHEVLFYGICKSCRESQSSELENDPQ
ncbi:Fur family transcriptional regulator [Coraliomargarita sp. W4R72]